ncbi:MAG: NBR1-Ig-like domain-containing protein [Anaerolineae bacterium]|nr:NBR1-Ig-like domain-containing protein [Anaerolineae bacterium]MDW8069759.1 NBR1-Ig-like domain-containing protein [Anaerolineae bacterium]
MNGRTPIFGPIVAASLLLLAALACGPVRTIVVTATPPPEVPTATPEVAAPATTAPATPAPPVATPPPEPTTAAGCTLGARWVADVTVPDNTVFAPGTPFVKTWRVRNSGTCTWALGTRLVFVSGAPMGGPPAVDVPALAPGAQTDVSVSLVAPATPGTYRANYQLQAPDGTRFGAIIWVQIVVPGTPTTAPVCTPPPCPSGGILMCPTPGTCPGGCGVICVTPTTMAPVCTPPSCPSGGILVCPTPGACPGGCGVVCLTPTPGPCTTVDPALAPVVGIASTFGVNPGCPTGPSFSIYGAFQKFETNPENPNPQTHMGAFMIWRSDTRKIYALGMGSEYTSPTHNGRWLGVYDDRWDESQPPVHPVCAGMSVPSGFQLPVRGFGKVWCENGLWASDRVGWPRDREWGVDLLVQPTERGLLVRVRNYPDGYHYLFALDLPAGKWASTAFRP